LLLVIGGPQGCHGEATVRGSVKRQHGLVQRATIVMRCPGQPNRVTATDANGEFTFKDLGPGVDGACTVEVESDSFGGAARTVASRCGESDTKSGQCKEAIFAFDLGS
jgi:hypothetical protein